MSKTAIFLATGYEEIEALTVVDVLRRAGEEVFMVSITGERVVASSHGVEVKADKLLSELNFDEGDVIVLPGGMPGTKNLEACGPLMEQVDAFVEAGKLVAAVCAAPSILGHRGHLKGKKACSFPSFEDHLEGAQVSRDAAVRDGNIITGRGMGVAIPFALTILEALQSREAAQKIADTIVFQNC